MVVRISDWFKVSIITFGNKFMLPLLIIQRRGPDTAVPGLEKELIALIFTFF
jgi:hypothetical protein